MDRPAVRNDEGVTPRLARPALLGVLLVTLALTGCDDAGSSTAAAAPTRAMETDEEPAVATPTDLVHPCDVVTSKVASKLLGVRVRATRVEDKMTGRSLDCSYVPAKQTPDAPFLELLTAPDPRLWTPSSASTSGSTGSVTIRSTSPAHRTPR